MRHRIAGKKLNRSAGHRKALFKNLAKDFFKHGQIVTTQAKAKAVQPIIEKMITRAKKQNLQARRLIQSFLNDRSITNHVIDQIVPQIGTRTSGHTRLRRVEVRKGDSAVMTRLSFVDTVTMERTDKKKVQDKKTD